MRHARSRALRPAKRLCASYAASFLRRRVPGNVAHHRQPGIRSGYRCGRTSAARRSTDTNDQQVEAAACPLACARRDGAVIMCVLLMSVAPCATIASPCCDRRGQRARDGITADSHRENRSRDPAARLMHARGSRCARVAVRRQSSPPSLVAQRLNLHSSSSVTKRICTAAYIGKNRPCTPPLALIHRTPSIPLHASCF